MAALPFILPRLREASASAARAPARAAPAADRRSAAARLAGSAASAAAVAATEAPEGKGRSARQEFDEVGSARSGKRHAAPLGRRRARALPPPRSRTAPASSSDLHAIRHPPRSNVPTRIFRVAPAHEAPAAPDLRPQAPARRPGCRHRQRHGRHADARGDADRRRQVALLPAARAAAAGHDARRLAADRAHEGPVRQAARARRRRGPAQQRGRCRGDRCRRAGDPRRRCEDRLHDPGAARRSGLRRARRRAAVEPARRRRSALHLAVGTRL